VVYREFFPRGLTALDDLDEATLGTRPNLSHVTAQEEVTNFLRILRLPLAERGRRRAATRAEWVSAADKPLELHDIVLDVTGQDGFVSIEGLFNQTAKEVPAFSGLEWAKVGDTGVNVPL
jgi:hypothetical protein